MKNALIMGATGATGSELVKLLIQSPLYNEIHIVHYRETKFKGLPKITEHIIDMDRLIDQLNIQEPIHDIFCTIGTTRKKAKSIENFIRIDLDYILELGQWAKNEKVNSFNVISSSNANKDSFFLYLKTKGKMEQKLSELQLSQLNIFRPPLLYAPNRSEIRLIEKWIYVVLKYLSMISPAFARRQRPLPVTLLAQKMLSYAQEKNDNIKILEPSDLQ